MARNSGISAMGAVRVAFGIFMVIVYLGMAYLLAVNFFDWSNTPLWRTVRWAMAAIFGLYGLWRCYRQITGIDYYRLDERQSQGDEPSRIDELIKNVEKDEKNC